MGRKERSKELTPNDGLCREQCHDGLSSGLGTSVEAGRIMMMLFLHNPCVAIYIYTYIYIKAY